VAPRRPPALAAAPVTAGSPPDRLRSVPRGGTRRRELPSQTVAVCQRVQPMPATAVPRRRHPVGPGRHPFGQAGRTVPAMVAAPPRHDHRGSR
jgi:hypothetical protein